MKSKRLIGRKKECDRLDKCMSADSSQLIIVYGRRRVGKTFLINEYFGNSFDFKLTGAYDQPKDIQLRNFTSELNRKSKREWTVPKDWIQAFEMLRSYLEGLPETDKHVVFFDEMPWLDTHKSGFVPAFEWFWNDWASTQDNLVFIVCGSATSWMTDKLSNNKGGLFNRQTCRLYLEPFNLKEAEEYLESRGISWSRYDIAECYMIMGGIPYYLSLLDSELSLSQNVDNLFFRKKAELWDEFKHLYNTLFTNGDNYIKVVETLSSKNGGLTRKELSESAGLPANGSLTKILSNLADSGFIRVSSFYGRKKKEIVYQLTDYYTWFYLRFVKDNYGKDEHFWSNAIDNPKRRSWAGLTFEQLCKDHIPQIKNRLGISGVLSEESVWFYRGESKDEKGVQIDLLIDRRDRVINICEIKFSIGEYTIDADYELTLRTKAETFRNVTSCRKTLQMTIISTYGVRKNKHSSIVQNEVVLDDLFE